MFPLLARELPPSPPLSPQQGRIKMLSSLKQLVLNTDSVSWTVFVDEDRETSIYPSS